MAGPAEALDAHVELTFKVLQEHGWLLRTTKPGNRSILCSSPGSYPKGWSGVHVHFAGDPILTAYCSGVRARTLQTTYDLLQATPVQITEQLMKIAAAHRALTSQRSS